LYVFDTNNGHGIIANNYIVINFSGIASPMP